MGMLRQQLFFFLVGCAVLHSPHGASAAPPPLGCCFNFHFDRGGGSPVGPLPPSPLTLRGRLKRSARAVQLFGRLAVLETHALRS